MPWGRDCGWSRGEFGGKEGSLDLPSCGWRTLLYTANVSHVVVIAWPSFPCKRNTVLLEKRGGWMIANRSNISLSLH